MIIFRIKAMGRMVVYPILGNLFPARSEAKSKTAGWLAAMPDNKENGIFITL